MTLLDRALTRLRSRAGAGGQGQGIRRAEPVPDGGAGDDSLRRGGGPARRERSGRAPGGAPAAPSASGNCSGEEITQTVAAPEEVDEEIRHLLAALSG